MNRAGTVVFKLLLVTVPLVATFLNMPCVAAEETKPRIFITDSTSWEVIGAAGGSNGVFASSISGGARPQTAEIVKTFGERCQQVLVNNKVEKADYVVVLDHEGGKGYLRKRNKIAVFNKEGDAIVSRSTRSLGNSVQDACGAITSDWARHSSSSSSSAAGAARTIPPAIVKSQEVQPTSASVTPLVKGQVAAPNQLMPLPVAEVKNAAGTEPAEGVGTVSVTSNPEGAEIFIDSVGTGRAPAILKLKLGEHSVQLVLQGYKDWSSQMIVKGNSIVNVSADL